jgi:pimeloyl-ACP methyl ester carboxylesterase
MPYLVANGVRLAYQRAGHGPPVLMIMGTGAAGRVWTMHQTPALESAGYETVTFDNRGIPPSDCPAGEYTLDDVVGDTAGLIQALGLAPCHVVGTSMGAMIAQELALTGPELVASAVLIATRSRADATRRALALGEQAIAAAGAEVPAAFQAANSVLQMLSPATLDNDEDVSLWLEIFELAGGGVPGHGQAWIDTVSDRRAALSEIAVPCRVIAFSDDLISPPHLAAEVADAIPDCDYVEIPGCGHLGYLERPRDVNTAIIEFLDKHR